MNQAEATCTRLGVSRETSERLEALVDLLRKWGSRINLVGRRTLDDVWVRHIEDSAQVFFLAPPHARSWIDLGSGGGFPGLVVGALAQEFNPELDLTLVESDARKCAFLAAASREMGISPTILAKRIETLGSGSFDVISARALAPLDQLLAMSERFAHARTVRLFPKGENVASELTAARKHWHIEHCSHPSATDAKAVILEIQEVSRATGSRT
ncbi:MAG: 16S rRNA (guanine(527)-N(7))-methyltransferase RsmG [Pseudomonadota bacterium]